MQTYPIVDRFVYKTLSENKKRLKLSRLQVEMLGLVCAFVMSPLHNFESQREGYEPLQDGPETSYLTICCILDVLSFSLS